MVIPKKRILNSYNKVANFYDLMNRLYFLGKDKKYRSMLVERIIERHDECVLVLCCGTGLDFPVLLQKTEEELVGVDISSEMLKKLSKKRENRRVALVRADVEHLPFKEGTFNSIIVSFCLKIIPSLEKAIRESSRVLEPAGKIGILANSKPSGFWRLAGIIITKFIGRMAKIDYTVDITTHLSKTFLTIEDRELHWGLVRFLIGKKIPDRLTA
jgi:demethylmenaquinone methyltransferase/2-methoxy-6-polyprenyl-1,4-benzoquinol methylase